MRSWKCSSFIDSKSKARLPCEPLISRRMAFLRPVAKRVASNEPIAPPAKRAVNSAASSTVTGPVAAGPLADSPLDAAGSGRSLTKVSVSAETPVIGDAGQVLREVDDVGADVAERTGARLVLLQPPDQRELRVDDPVLQVLRPHVADRPEPALGRRAAGQGDRRHPAVGEADHRAHAARLRPPRGVGHVDRLVDGVGERLLAQHVLAGLERRDGDVGVRVARRADVDEVDVVPGDQPPPVGLDRGPARAGRPTRRPRRRPGRTGRSARRRAAGRRSGRPRPALRVGGAHEGVADHADAQRAVVAVP